jgi:hypothetical protein
MHARNLGVLNCKEIDIPKCNVSTEPDIETRKIKKDEPINKKPNWK